MKTIKSNPEIPICISKIFFHSLKFPSWYAQVNNKSLKLHIFGCHTFPDPEQFEHLSVFGADKGWSPPLTVETGSIRTRAPVFEQRAQARYPAFTISMYKIQHLEYSRALKTGKIEEYTSSKTILASFMLLLFNIVYFNYHQGWDNPDCSSREWCHYRINLTAFSTNGIHWNKIAWTVYQNDINE